MRSRGEELHRREVGAVPLRVPGQHAMAVDCRVCAEVEVRQRRRSGAATAAIGEERLAGEEPRLERELLPLEDVRGKLIVVLFDGGEADRDLGVDDGVDDERALIRGVRQGAGGPRRPRRVFGGDVEQDVAVDECRGQGSRVSARISSVVR